MKELQQQQQHTVKTCHSFVPVSGKESVVLDFRLRFKMSDGKVGENTGKVRVNGI